MASDLASIAESGGLVPKPRAVKFSSQIEREKERAREMENLQSDSSGSDAPVVAQASQKSFFSEPIFLFSLLAVLLAAVFFVGYYFVYPLLNPK